MIFKVLILIVIIGAVLAEYHDAQQDHHTSTVYNSEFSIKSVDESQNKKDKSDDHGGNNKISDYLKVLRGKREAYDKPHHQETEQKPKEEPEEETKEAEEKSNEQIGRSGYHHHGHYPHGHHDYHHHGHYPHGHHDYQHHGHHGQHHYGHHGHYPYRHHGHTWG